jgi:hypothetical protein
MTSPARIIVSIPAAIACIAVAGAPVASADRNGYLACMKEGVKSFTSCCIDNGGGYAWDPAHEPYPHCSWSASVSPNQGDTPPPTKAPVTVPQAPVPGRSS